MRDGFESRRVDLDADRDHIATQPGHNPTRSVTSDKLAYLVYTSGSTGKPKGVMVSHQSLVNYASFLINRYRIGSSDRRLQFASAGTELFLAEATVYSLGGATLG